MEKSNYLEATTDLTRTVISFSGSWPILTPVFRVNNLMEFTDPSERHGLQPAERLFFDALPLSQEERAKFLRTACGGNPELLSEVLGLLQACSQSDGFLEPPALPQSDIADAVTVDDHPGDKIGVYRLTEKIGEGGFGTVWVAEQEKPVRRQVALKILKLGMDTKQVVARFEQERQALAVMDHPNIAKVFDAGTTPVGRPFFAMELVRGPKITTYADQERLSATERLKLFILVCYAVQHAHQKGVIHRDLKPSNILVTDHNGSPAPKVIDFGVAKAIQQQSLSDLTVYTRLDQIIGTPLYMAPEQTDSGDANVDTRSDIYSLGVLLYELLTGKTPFDRDRLLRAGYDEIRRVIREEEPQKPSTVLSTMPAEKRTRVAGDRNAEGAKLIRTVRGDLDWIVMKALEKDRNRRYDSASGLAKEIERHLNNEPVLARRPSRYYKLQKFLRRNRMAAVAIGATALALTVGAAVSTWQAIEANYARRAVDDERQRNRGIVSQVSYERARDQLELLENSQPVALALLARALRFDPEHRRALRLAAGLLSKQSPLVPVAAPFVHRRPVGDIAISSDGLKILTNSDGGISLWSVLSSERLLGPVPSLGNFTGRNRLEALTTATLSHVYSNPDGNDDFQLWNTKTGTALGARFQPDRNISSQRVMISSVTNRALIDMGPEKGLFEQDLNTGEMKRLVINPPIERIVSSSLSRDGRTWLLAAEPRPTPNTDGTSTYPRFRRVFKVFDGKIKESDSVISPPFALSADANRAIFLTPDDVERWNTKWTMRSVDTSSLLLPATSHSTAQEAGSGSNAPTGDERSQTFADFFRETHPSLRPNDTLKLEADSGAATAIAVIWSTTTGFQIVIARDIRDRNTFAKASIRGTWITAESELRFLDSGSKFAILDKRRRSLRIFDSSSLSPITPTFDFENGVSAFSLSPTGEQIATGDRDGLARIWRIRQSPSARMETFGRKLTGKALDDLEAIGEIVLRARSNGRNDMAAPWVSDFLEAMGGITIDDNGKVYPVKQPPATVLASLPKPEATGAMWQIASASGFPRSDVLRTIAGPLEPNTFQYEYKHEDPGTRFWTLKGEIWTEQSPTGVTKHFRKISHAIVDDQDGTVCKNEADPRFEVFVPNLGVQNARIQFRVSGGEWKSLGFVECAK